MARTVRTGGVAAVVVAHLRAKGGGRRAALNFALHAQLALAAGMLLPLAPAAHPLRRLELLNGAQTGQTRTVT